MFVILSFYHRHFIVTRITLASQSRVSRFAQVAAPDIVFVVELSLTTMAD
jgi:hypothetical protein